jgi:methylornithine synthase
MANLTIERILAKAEQRSALSREEIVYLLKNGADASESLFRLARELRSRHFLNEIFLYGFVYFSTWCHNDCTFCYYRQSNPQSSRYRKSDLEILEAAGSLTDSGVHLIDLTSGEDSYYMMQPDGQEMLATLVRAVKRQSGLPVMVSPGVVTEEALQQFAAVGADWYACYQETYNRELFQRLRLNQSFDRRLQAKQLARKQGLLVEEGILRGVGETLDDLALSLISMQEIGAQQVRVMGFVPQAGTPMDQWATPDLIEELIVIAVLRLLFPDRLIPASLDVDGVAGLQARLNAGANVVTSLIPPHLGLAGVAQSTRDIDEGFRTVSGVRPVLERLGLQPATPGRYRDWVAAEKHRLNGESKLVTLS